MCHEISVVFWRRRMPAAEPCRLQVQNDDVDDDGQGKEELINDA